MASQTELATKPADWVIAERLLKLVLIATGISLAGFACYLSAIPHLPGGVAPGTNDARAIAAMATIVAAQEQFRCKIRLDTNGDSISEFGTLAQLTNSLGTLPRAFTASSPEAPVPGAVRYCGFWFWLSLPPSRDSWKCYAWPVQQNNTGKRVLFADHDGVVWRRHRSDRDSTIPAWDAKDPDQERWWRPAH